MKPKQAKSFVDKLHQQCSVAPDPAEVLAAEQELGSQSIAYALGKQGLLRLFRAHDKLRHNQMLGHKAR